MEGLKAMSDEIKAATVHREVQLEPKDFWELGRFSREFAMNEAMRYTAWTATFVDGALLPTEAKAVEYLKRATALIAWLTSPTSQPEEKPPLGSCDKHRQCAGRRGHVGDCMFLGAA